jgi:hypothetical protein
MTLRWLHARVAAIGALLALSAPPARSQGVPFSQRGSVSRDVLIDGKPMRAGEYSLWLIPREVGPWTVILSRAAHVFHNPYPGANFDALRVDVTPEQASHMESLAIYFPVVLRDETVLRLHWGTTAVPLRIKAPFRPRPERASGARAKPRRGVTS